MILWILIGIAIVLYSASALMIVSAVRVGRDMFREPRPTFKFTNTEANRSATIPAIGKVDEPPKGLGRDGHKPLMRNRKPDEASPIGNAGITFRPRFRSTALPTQK